MTYLKTLSILAVSTLGLSAVSAGASEMPDAQVNTQAMNEATSTLETTLDAQDTLMRVTDNEGRVFYNHVVAIDDLPETDINIEVEDTYTFEYNGRTYTNVIVAPS